MTSHDYALADLLAELRTDLAAESPMALHGHAAPKEKLEEWRIGDEGGIGRPFTAAFARLLSHPDHWGGWFLARASILEVRDWCQSRHPEHRMPGTPYSTCERLLYKCAVEGHTPRYAAWVSGIAADRAEALLLPALAHAADWRHRELHKAQARIYGDKVVIACPKCPEPGTTIGGRAA